MRKIFLIITILLFFKTTFAQNREADSLRNVINSSKADTAVMQACIKLATSLAVNNFDSNLLYARKGLAIAVKRKDTINTGILYDCMGWAHYFKGSFDSAGVYYYKSIAVLEKRPASVALGAVYNDIAKLYRKTGAYDRALNFYSKAMTVYQSLDDEGNVATIYNESGVVYEYQHNYDAALGNYQKSLHLKQKLKDSIGVSYALSFMAGVYNMQGKYKQAEDNSLQALHIRQLINDSFAIALSYSDLGDIYQAAGNLAKAKENYSASNVYVRKLNYPDFLSSNLKQLSDIANKENDYKTAFDYYRQYTAIKDSLFRLESAKQVEELSDKYETAEKAEIIQQQKFQINKRNYLIAGIAGLVLLGSLLVFSSYRRYRLKQQAKLQQEILRQQDMATKAIIAAEETERKRIAGDLHDGVGQIMSAARMNLSSIQNEIPFASQEQKNKFEKVVALIDDSCNEVRMVSHNMMPNALLKSGLALAIREFIDKIDRNALQISLYAEGLNEKIDSNVETVLYRVIQECVNNVIKHSGANRLDISLINETDSISATIEDNGKGFDTKNKANFEGIGLKNIQSRIDYLKGTVEWDSMPGRGTVVAIIVPLGASQAP